MSDIAASPPSTPLLAHAHALRDLLAVDAAGRDRERRFAHAEFAQLRRSGLLAARVPREHGGPGLPISDVAELLRVIAQGDPNVAQALQPHFAFMDSLRLDATDAQRDRIFGAVAGGHLIANAFAERGGRFIGDIATTLVREGAGATAGWRLNGTKYYCTGSLYADQLYVTGVTADGGRATAVIPVDRRGVRIADDWDASGQRTTGSGTVTLDDVAVHDAEVIALANFGRRSYRGATAQLMHAAIDAGIAAAAVDHFHSGDTDPARIDRRLAQASIAVAQAKACADEASLRVSEFAFRLGGASAAARERNLDRHWRNARTHTTHDPVAYKYKAIGDWLLNDALPPITTKI